MIKQGWSSASSPEWLFYTENSDRANTVEDHTGPIPAVLPELPWPHAISSEDCKRIYQIKAESDSLVTKSMLIRLSMHEAAAPEKVWAKWCLWCLYRHVPPLCSLHVIQRPLSTEVLSGNSKLNIIAIAVDRRQVFCFSQSLLFLLRCVVDCKKKTTNKILWIFSGRHAACHLPPCASLARFKADEKKLTNISKEYFTLIKHFVLTATFDIIYPISLFSPFLCSLQNPLLVLSFFFHQHKWDCIIKYPENLRQNKSNTMWYITR